MTYFRFYTLTGKLITRVVADDEQTALFKAKQCIGLGLLPPGSAMSLHCGHYTVKTSRFTGSAETAENIRRTDKKARSMICMPRRPRSRV